MDIDLKKTDRGFSLVEMLMVVAIIALLSTLGTLALQDALAASRIDEASRTVTSEIAFARQLASSRNLPVQIRFIEQTNEEGTEVRFGEIRTGYLSPGFPPVFNEVKSPAKLPITTTIDPSTTHSPLLALLPSSSLDSDGPPYRVLTVRPTSEIDPVVSLDYNDLARWCITIIPEHSVGKPISEINNFATILLDPLSGRTRTLRP